MTKISHQCEICGKKCYDKSAYNKHKNKKVPCVSHNIIAEYELKNKLKEDTLEEKERENARLKEIIIKLVNKEKIEETLSKKIDNTFNTLLTEIKNTNSTCNTLVNKVDVMENTLDEHKDKLIIQSQTNNILCNNNNMNDNKMVFAMSFTEKTNERVNHISQDDMMDILNHNEYNDTLKHLTKAVYFHPLAPQNWKWCVNDKNAQLGALEYDADTHSVSRKPAGEVINRNLQNAVFQLTDILGELNKAKRVFNETQNRNREKIYNSLGNDFTLEQINNVKNAAYDGRNLVKALWESLHLKLNADPITCKIKMK